LRGKYFDVVSIAAEPLQAKAAFTSARNVRRAVDRIAIKRRLREAYRLEQPDVPPRVMVFVGNEKTLSAQFTNLRLQMRQILVKFSNQNRD